MGRRKSRPGFTDAPGVSRTSSQAASAVSVVGVVLRGFPAISERLCCRCDGRRKDCGGPCGRQTPAGLDGIRPNRSI